MAGSLGSLVVSLGLNAAEFTTGLTKSEYEARKFAQRLDRQIAQAARTAGAAILAMGAAAAGAFAAVNRLAEESANFQDLEEKTGANAEALASFAVAAGTAGTSMETIAGGLNKLTKGMVSTEDETKDAGAALAALGLNVQEFKALDPARQIEAVAQAMAKFQDGAAKTAVAMALFGRSGAELLPFLKELAAEGGRQVILTQQQIERADAYADAQAKARAQLQLYLQSLATEALPAITVVTRVTAEFVKELVGVTEAARKLPGVEIRSFGESAALALAKVVDVGDAVVRVFRVSGEALAAYAAQARLPFWDFSGRADIGREANRRIEAILMERTATQRLTSAFKEAAQARKLAAQEDRGFVPPGRALDFRLSGTRAGAGIRQQIGDAERYIATLQEQIDRTLELTAVEEARIAIGKFKVPATQAQEEQILAIARQIDAYRELERWLNESRRAFDEEVRALQDAARERVKLADEALREADQIAEANRAMRDEIEIIVGGEDARRRLERQRVANAIAIKEEAQALAQMDPQRQSEAAALQSTIVLLRERLALLDSRDLAERLRADAEAFKRVNEALGDAFANSLDEFIAGTKSASDAFKSFARDVESALRRIAINNLTDALFGTSRSGGADLSVWLQRILGLLGGSGGGLGYGTIGSNIPSGPYPYANGTAFHPGGMAWVGERGPELLRLPRGAQVIPNDEIRKATRGVNINQTINVLPGASTQSARQAAEKLRDATMRAIRER